MRWLLFLSKVAFIANLFFLVCLLIRHTHYNVPVAAREFVIINGWIMSVIFNAIFAIAVFIILARRKRTGVAGWLLAANICCFLFQILYQILIA